MGGVGWGVLCSGKALKLRNSDIGSLFQTSEDIDTDFTHRIRARWTKYRQVRDGLCDK